MDDQAETLTVEMVDGTKIVVPNSLEVISTYVLLEQGDWFENEIRFLRSIVQSGQTVIDIGANYGVYTLSLARRVGPAGKVWAFEPAAEPAQLLRISVQRNDIHWVELQQQAISDHSGTAWLQTPGQSELNSLRRHGDDSSLPAAEPGERVSLTTLDDGLEHWSWPSVDILKIDAEGEEERILQGGRRFFETLSPLVMFEVKAGSDLHLELVGHFESMGYRCFRLVPGLNALVPFSASEPVDAYLLNLFAAKPDRSAALASAGVLLEEAADGDAAAGVDPGRWREALQALPYAQALDQRWRANEEGGESASLKLALAAWALSQDPSQPLRQRFEALQLSARLFRQQIVPGCPCTRWASLARVALELGERQMAMGALDQLLAARQDGGPVLLDEPFLCPSRGFEAIQPLGCEAAWLEAAALETLELFLSHSGFFTGASARPRLERLLQLGWLSPAIRTRLTLLEQRFGPSRPSDVNDPALAPAAASGDPHRLEDDAPASIDFWFDFLNLARPLRCLDVGAMALAGQPDPWLRWAIDGTAEVIGFDPLAEQGEHAHQRAAQQKAGVRTLPWVLADGREHRVYVYAASEQASITTSLYPPAAETISLFLGLDEQMQIAETRQLQTRRLDDLAEACAADFIRLRARGGELLILQNAQRTLQDIAVIQCEAEFIELYQGQPLFADLDAYLRSQGFCLLRFSPLTGRPYKPLESSQEPLRGLSQQLWTDAVYVRDVRTIRQWKERQLQVAALILHEIYQAYDLAALLIAELDRRSHGCLQECYLGSLLISHPELSVRL